MMANTEVLHTTCWGQGPGDRDPGVAYPQGTLIARGWSPRDSPRRARCSLQMHQPQMEQLGDELLWKLLGWWASLDWTRLFYFTSCSHLASSSQKRVQHGARNESVRFSF